jgi:hypothetical protein
VPKGNDENVKPKIKEERIFKKVLKNHIYI